MNSYNIYLITLLFPFFILSQSSLNMEQIGNLEYNQDLNDVWGYVAPNGEEHALVGCANGFSYVNISDPSNPYEVFFVPGSNSIWRDLKTWDHYAYITTEAEDGLLIVDLNDLSGQSYVYTTDFFNTSHNIYIDEFGYAYIFGADDEYVVSNGGAVILDLNLNPMNPTLAGVFDSYYLHDGMVRDNILWGSAIYEGVFAAIDVSDKSDPVILGSAPTSCNFTHNAWISDDGNFVFTTDEQQSCYIGAYDVSNISDIQQVDQIQSWNNVNSPVIPHNTHVMGNYLVTSYYTSGITVVDASDPSNLIEVAYYDTSPDYDGGEFEGCWGAYPFLPSGLLLASDQQTGLHILEMIDPIYGCTNEIASNYNPDATADDGSCLILGCTDSEALNYNVEANVDNESCEYLCDGYIIIPPIVQSDWIVQEGESIILSAEANGNIYWLDSQNNILDIGPSYTTDPIFESTMFYLYNEEVVEEGVQGSAGEENHVCGGNFGCDYSGGEYNSYLVFDCMSSFNLNSLKVYASSAGQRTIELRDSGGQILNSTVVFVPESANDGYVIDLNWEIGTGYGYRIGTNTQMNQNNFGENNPGFKRTTLGQQGEVLTNYPYQFDDILEITSSEYGTDYYYYFYDWSISTPNQTCISESVPVHITLHQTNLNDLELSKSIIGIFDLLGRNVDKIEKEGFYFKMYNNGSIKKFYHLD